jgi:squalene synthase HpnC
MPHVVADAAVATIAATRRERAENFPVALRLLPAVPRRHLHAVYAAARLIDDVGDDVTRTPAQRRAALDELRADLTRIWSGGVPAHAVFRALADTVNGCALPQAPFNALIDANCIDQTTRRYRTFADLRGYCALSADPVGHLVLAIAGRSTPAMRALSDDVCTALQVLEHCQDVVEDFRDRDRIYLPLDDLDRHCVAERELAEAPATPALRALIAFEVDRAARLLASGGQLVRELCGWSRWAVAGYIAGGRATVDAFARQRYDVASGLPRPRRRDVGLHMVRLLARRP